MRVIERSSGLSCARRQLARIEHRPALAESREIIAEQLAQIRDTANLYADRLDAISDPEERANELCRLNVAEQVLNVAETTVVQDAWGRGQELCIHGWIYGLKDGIIRNLEISVSGDEELSELRRKLTASNKPDLTGSASY